MPSFRRQSKDGTTAGSADSLGIVADGPTSPPATPMSRTTPAVSAVATGAGEMSCSEVRGDCPRKDPVSPDDRGGGDGEGRSGCGIVCVGVGNNTSLSSATRGGVGGSSSALAGAGDNGDRGDVRCRSTSIAATPDASPPDPALRRRSRPGGTPGRDSVEDSGGPYELPSARLESMRTTGPESGTDGVSSPGTMGAAGTKTSSPLPRTACEVDPDTELSLPSLSSKGPCGTVGIDAVAVPVSVSSGSIDGRASEGPLVEADTPAGRLPVVVLADGKGEVPLPISIDRVVTLAGRIPLPGGTGGSRAYTPTDDWSDGGGDVATGASSSASCHACSSASCCASTCCCVASRCSYSCCWRW